MTTAPMETRADVLTFVDGMPGFPGQQQFAIVAQPGLEPFMTLESLDEDGPSFVVVPPSAVIDEYEVPVDTDVAAALGITDPEDAFILSIVAVAGDGGTHTVNLLGPLVVNRVTGRARQVVLVDSSWPLEHPLA